MFEFILKNKIKNAFDNNTRTHLFRPEHAIRRVMLLYNIEDWEQISLIIEDMKKRGKTVSSWTTRLTPDSKKITPQIEGTHIITTKETPLLSGVSSWIKYEFEAKTYDTLIDFTIKPEDVLLYLLALNSSEFCVGIKEMEEKMYDFVVLKSEQRTLVETYNQIKFYLNNIR